MTVSQLYALYRAGHAQARRRADELDIAPADLEVRPTGLTALESVILQLALHDVTNGTALRSLPSFERAIQDGADLLRSLGLRLEAPRRPDPVAAHGAVAEAA